MQQLHAQNIISISELKKNPTQVINQANGQPVAILNHNVAAAYLVPAATYERILGMLDDQMLVELTTARINDDQKPIKVDIDEL
ncbi:MAG: type II toxin-antitoxin system prevent-host-death family antitoxin [Coxiellaceae bacterium]|nr:type II toxin-antitoxin system prevent-host-death family antitoxin [Coxiellaceae bacterium]